VSHYEVTEGKGKATSWQIELSLFFYFME